MALDPDVFAAAALEIAARTPDPAERQAALLRLLDEADDGPEAPAEDAAEG